MAIDQPDGAWSLLLGGPPPAPELAGEWLVGLSCNRAASVAVQLRLLDTHWRVLLYRLRTLAPEVVEAAASHPLKKVRSGLLSATEDFGPGTLTVAQWDLLLASTPEQDLRAFTTEVRKEADRQRGTGYGKGVDVPPPGAAAPRTAAEIEAMADAVPGISPGQHTRGLWWVGALFGQPEAMRQLASSPKLWVRRSVARAPRLPKDVAGLLARDDDRVVRLFLAESCDDAPPEMLLEVWSWWQGSLSFPGRPRSHPSFPREGLLRFANDPNPVMRLLALDDPASTPELVEHLSRDPAEEARCAAAGDSRLTPEAAARLARDPSADVRRAAASHPALPAGDLLALTRDRDCHVRLAACTHPGLPPEMIARLLQDPDTAQDTAQNPAIPHLVMDAMITLARAATAS